MCKLRWALSVVCLYSVGAWAQGAPQVFVSTGSAGTIYSLNPANGSLTQLVYTQGADYEGMVVAPDNAVADLPPADPAGTTHYLVYVCDTANSRIWRFDPTAPATLERIYGDLVVSSTVAGSGLWVFSGITNVALGSGVQTPTHLIGVSGSSEGIAQKNIGDLLVVDRANGSVLRTPLASPNTTSFITGLSQPFGIARRGDGAVFVGSQGQQNVTQFDAQGANPATCQTFSDNDVPNFMQMALDNTLYVAVAGRTGGSVRSINANTCQATHIYAVPNGAVGIALPPTMMATQNVTVSNGTVLLNFGFTAFELNQISGPCSGTVSAGLASPAAIYSLIGLSSTPADPAVNLGLDGFEVVFSTAGLNGCNSASGANSFQVSDLVSPAVNNPEIVVCDDPNTNCQPGNTNLQQLGAWPIGGYLPSDLTSGGSKSLRCNIFLVNARQMSTLPGQEIGTFCGFNPPVNNTFTGTLNSWNTALSSTFKSGSTVAVKFNLALGTSPNACRRGPFINDAEALLSIALIEDANGNPVFVPIMPGAHGSAGPITPLFNVDGSRQYAFNWDTSSCVMPSGQVQTCPLGKYSLSVEFLTNNTTGGAQSIYGVQTTIVKLR
jgi:hypothetical protein